MDCNIELTSSRVSKGTTQAPFIPKIRARKIPQLLPPVKEITQQQVQTLSKLSPTILNIEKTKNVPPVKGNLIVIPTAAIIKPQVEIVIHEKEVDDFDENTQDISKFTISNLIKSKFKRGELSASQEALHFKKIQQKLSKTDSAITIKQPPNPVPITKAVTTSAPQFHLVNGSIQIDTSSLQVVQQVEDYSSLQRIDEDVVRRITSSSFRNKKRPKFVKWTLQMTDRFYDGLSYFGTNFEIIALMFPELTRKNLKLKFDCEETRNPGRITDALRSKKEPDESLKQRMMDQIPEKDALLASQYINPPLSLLNEFKCKGDIDMGSVGIPPSLDTPPDSFSLEAEADLIVGPEILSNPISIVVIDYPHEKDNLMQSQVQKQVDIALAQARPRSTNISQSTSKCFMPNISVASRRKKAKIVDE